ncbi:hypothetical protein ACFOWZ_16770 [Lentzea rhizosphaerae]|uniref:Uncharacterized protein n=1 Tax=Lentzea rhizosphaerae TaxID=2041025 RepID=A0ABV8BVF2_9PSEU
MTDVAGAGGSEVGDTAESRQVGNDVPSSPVGGIVRWTPVLSVRGLTSRFDPS